MCTGLSNFETFFCDGHNKEVLFKYLAKCTSSLQLDDKTIVSTSDDVLNSRNHKHLITTIMQIQNCSFVCVMLCKMVMTGSWYAQNAGLWVAIGTGMQLCYIQAHLVYSSLGPDQSKALTSFYTLTGCDTTLCFSERINKWLASKLNDETFLPRTSTLSQRYTKAVPEHCLSNNQHSAVLLQLRTSPFGQVNQWRQV